MSFNICSELKCPHSYKTGCDQFTVSQHCPLAAVPNIEANQYWLFADETADIDINQLRSQLEAEVLATETSQRRLCAEANYRETPPVMRRSQSKRIAVGSQSFRSSFLASHAAVEQRLHRG